MTIVRLSPIGWIALLAVGICPGHTLAKESEAANVSSSCVVQALQKQIDEHDDVTASENPAFSEDYFVRAMPSLAPADQALLLREAQKMMSLPGHVELTAAELAPRRGPSRYATRSLNDGYSGEERGASSLIGNSKVIYLDSEAAREPFRVVIKDGVFYNSRGVRLLSGYPYLFVMDAQGNFYLMPSKIGGKIQHSTLLAGGKVADAGHLELDDMGMLTEKADWSGHYTPDRAAFRQGVHELESRGVKMSQVRVRHARIEPEPSHSGSSWLEGISGWLRRRWPDRPGSTP